MFFWIPAVSTIRRKIRMICLLANPARNSSTLIILNNIRTKAVLTNASECLIQSLYRAVTSRAMRPKVKMAEKEGVSMEKGGYELNCIVRLSSLRGGKKVLNPTLKPYTDEAIP